MPKSKGRKPQQGKQRGRAVGPGGYRPSKIRVNDDELKFFLSQLGPEQLLVLGLPVWLLWLAVGKPANSCLDTAVVLQHAFDLFGVRAEPRFVELIVEDTRTGHRTAYGTADPHFTSEHFVGHAGLWLPEHGRFLDVTVQQFPNVATAVPHGGWVPVSIPLPAGMSWGEPVRVPRGQHLLLDYYPVAEHVHDPILSHPRLGDPAVHRRSGTNLATNFLQWLRLPENRKAVAKSPFPKVKALIAAVGEAPIDLDQDKNFRIFPPNVPVGCYLDDIALNTARS